MASNLFPVSENDLAVLRERWMDLVSPYTSDLSLKENLFQAMYEKYSETTRSYHNLSHVQALLSLCESLQPGIQHLDAVQFSIWFHDVVYNTERNDNEEESAMFASETLAVFGVTTETVGMVRDLILATKRHNRTGLSDDGQLFLDMDLAILGTPEETYMKYSQAIRQEYSRVSEEAYRHGRRKVLENFLARERIYFTDELGARFEQQARKNIHVEIKALGT